MNREEQVKFEYEEISRLKELSTDNLIDELSKNISRESLIFSLLRDRASELKNKEFISSR